ncbi:MAG: hypothetical protein GBAus27B_000523 [Mycoplasmataceae bacterium]|nr:MAG: hypothetical protein GBAus27B_000523 [Mycoplasmataceae bacterium]
MSEKLTEKEKPIIIQLDENQYKHFLLSFGNIIRELNSIAFKVKELENGMKLIEAEIRLIRIELAGRDRKDKNS